MIKSGVKACILFAEGVDGNDVINYPQGPIPIYTWSQIINSVGSEIGSGVITKRIDNQTPGQCCNLVYTSGTTGEPKAVMLSHDNLSWTWLLYNNLKYTDAADLIDIDKPVKIVSFLPLSHITAQMADFSRQLVSLRPLQVTFAPKRILDKNLLH